MLPARILATGLLVWLALLAGLVLARILRGEISTWGLLSAAEGKSVDPERVAVAGVFPFVLAYYALRALGGDATTSDGHPSMPDIPDFFIVLLTGTNGLYLAGKIARR